ncbi:MAG: AbrB/MazE/SpoVT family DNA-binding domain-containing protein [Bryobacterales bacterium]|nr:AbrB/MazE/SpoVT family DNA-binding domain-containing protein [Bryobacterales bacterium]
MVKETSASSYFGRVGQRRQVVLPKPLCDEIGLVEGDFVEVSAKRGMMLVKPKRLVDADDTLTPAEARKVRSAVKQVREGKARPWSAVKRELDL